MTTLPLGVGAYKRTYGKMPEVQLINRFVERTPTNLKEQTSLLGRPGTKELAFFPPDTNTGQVRGTYSSPGIFNSDLFVVSGQNLYRYNSAGVRTQIAGQILGNGNPRVGFVKGAGYEHLFIADSLLLNYYGGGTHAAGTLTETDVPATGTLTGDGTVVANADTVTIGTKVYTFQTTLTNVDGNVHIGATAAATLTNLFNAINATGGGTPGTDYAAATTPHPLVTATNPSGTTVVVTARTPGPGGNTIASTKVSSHVSWGAATLGGGSTAVFTGAVIGIGGVYYGWSNTVNAGGPNGTLAKPFMCLPGSSTAQALANMANMLSFVGTPGTDFSNTLTTASLTVQAVSTATALTLSALSDQADGNAITTTVTGDTHLAWGGATLSGGGVHSLHGVPVPDGAGVSLVAVLNSFVWIGLNNSQQFYYVRPGAITINALDFANKESSPDPLVELVRVGDVMLVMGASSTEFWFATGDNANPFAPVQGRTLSRGCVPGTAVMVDERTVILVGNDNRVYSLSGIPTPISNHGIEERIRTQLRREAGIT